MRQPRLSICTSLNAHVVVMGVGDIIGRTRRLDFKRWDGFPQNHSTRCRLTPPSSLIFFFSRGIYLESARLGWWMRNSIGDLVSGGPAEAKR